MRGLILLSLLAGAFALAALWQQRHLDELRAERRAAEAHNDGLLRETPSGALEAGAGVLVVGRPSGAEPRPRPARAQPRARPAGGQGTGGAAHGPGATGDFTLEVQPGQTLSEIAHLRYGRSDAALVGALAGHNGLADPDLLRAGETLYLPPLEKLEAVAAGR